jgi:ribosome-associated protein
MLKINRQIYIPDGELRWTFVRAGGPGGQNVNKVASKAVLRWNVVSSPSLPFDAKIRLCQSQQRRIAADGDFIVSSQRFRDQERNRQDCLDKLRTAVLEAATPPKLRKPTRPTRSSREARLRAKRRRSQAKSHRAKPREE